jgi:DNA-binding transcriptional regulator YiaG
MAGVIAGDTSIAIWKPAQEKTCEIAKINLTLVPATMKITASNLKKIRAKMGKTQDDIARILAVTVSAISKIENGKRKMSKAEAELLKINLANSQP